MNYLSKILIGSLLLLLLFTACRKELNPDLPPSDSISTEENPIDIAETRATDQQLIEAQAIFVQILGISLVETAKTSVLVANNIQLSCPAINVVQEGDNCGDNDLITIDFGTTCTLSGGAKMSGLLNIRSFAPCETIGATEVPSLIATSESEKMILTFSIVTFNGYTIEYQQGQFSDGIFFWNGGNFTAPYFVFTFGIGDQIKVTHPNGTNYSQFIPFTAIPSLEITPNDPITSLNTNEYTNEYINELDAAEYSIKLLAQLNNQNQLVNYWRAQTYEDRGAKQTSNHFIITEDDEDLIMTPQCNAIKGGTLQLRNILFNPSDALVLSEYKYGYQASDATNLVECNSNNFTPTNLCEDYVWVCDYDTNGACNSCDLIKCFFAK